MILFTPDRSVAGSPFQWNYRNALKPNLSRLAASPYSTKKRFSKYVNGINYKYVFYSLFLVNITIFVVLCSLL